MKGVGKWWSAAGVHSPAPLNGGSHKTMLMIPLVSLGVNAGKKARPQQLFPSLTTCHASQKASPQDSRDDRGSSKRVHDERRRSIPQPSKSAQTSTSPTRSRDATQSPPPPPTPRWTPSPTSSPTLATGLSPRVPPTTPLLLFSTTGQLSLAQRPAERPLVPVSEAAAPLAGKKSPSAVVQQNMGAKAREVLVPHKDDKSARPRERKKPDAAPTAPKYSKAARRFFNERFREPQRLSKVK